MKQDTATLRALYAQIEEIYGHFKKIRQEAEGIATASQMPDATLHLTDVLESTEKATHNILDAATTIDSVTQASSMAAGDKAKVNAQVLLIYEACSFQDISGQRIKKVLRHLNELEHKLAHLSETARGKAQTKRADEHLLNGPALSGEAPSQAEIDALFKKM